MILSRMSPRRKPTDFSSNGIAKRADNARDKKRVDKHAIESWKAGVLRGKTLVFCAVHRGMFGIKKLRGRRAHLVCGCSTALVCPNVPDFY